MIRQNFIKRETNDVYWFGNGGNYSMSAGNKAKKGKVDVKVTIFLQIIVVATLIRQLFLGNWHSVFICVLTLLLFLVPSMIEREMNIRLPDTLEVIILLFIFAAEILGEIHNFYGVFKYWDVMLHAINGFLSAAIGFALIDILNRNEKIHLKLAPVFVAIVAFSFSMTIGVLWEFFEYTMDHTIATDMQKDYLVTQIDSVLLNQKGENIPVKIPNIQLTEIYNKNEFGKVVKTSIEGGYLDIGLNDTMKDLFVNFIGAVLFSIIGFLYIKNRGKYKFAEKFIPKMMKKMS